MNTNAEGRTKNAELTTLEVCVKSAYLRDEHKAQAWLALKKLEAVNEMVQFYIRGLLSLDEFTEQVKHGQ